MALVHLRDEWSVDGASVRSTVKRVQNAHLHLLWCSVINVQVRNSIISPQIDWYNSALTNRRRTSYVGFQISPKSSGFGKNVSIQVTIGKFISPISPKYYSLHLISANQTAIDVELSFENETLLVNNSLPLLGIGTYTATLLYDGREYASSSATYVVYGKMLPSSGSHNNGYDILFSMRDTLLMETPDCTNENVCYLCKNPIYSDCEWCAVDQKCVSSRSFCTSNEVFNYCPSKITGILCGAFTVDVHMVQWYLNTFDYVVLNSVQPTASLDTSDSMSVTLNVSGPFNSSLEYQCKFGDAIATTANFISSSLMNCSAPENPAGMTQVSLFYNNAQYTNSLPFLYFSKRVIVNRMTTIAMLFSTLTLVSISP